MSNYIRLGVLYMTIVMGSFVKCLSNDLGIAKVLDIYGESCKIEYFKSIADREQFTVSIFDLQKAKIYEQTRCYYFNEELQRWQIGRIRRMVDGQYEVDFPDCFSIYLEEKDLFVRCDTPIENPNEVLKLRGHETAFFNKRRTAFKKTLIQQRIVSRGMDGLMSSNILLLPHQIEVVRRVLEDPIQRYILADEVGLGKTIEAGLIVRQFLLDHPKDRVLFIVPPFLLDQWQDEMSQRFTLEDYEERIDWITSDNLAKLNSLKAVHNMVVIDEAHEVAFLAYSTEKDDQQCYNHLCNIVHHSAGLLLLSATPVLNNEKEFLSMLHLLDKENYALDDIEEFTNRVQKRQELGHLLLTFTEDSRPFLIKRSIKKIIAYFPNDFLLQGLLDKLERLLDKEDHDVEKRKNYIRDIRVHLSETYRLHRRLLRNRRESVKDQLTFGRDREQHDISVKCEYDLNHDASVAVMNLLDEWRNSAWASELAYWEEENVVSSNLSLLFGILFEASSATKRFFKSVLTSRLHQKAELQVKQEYTREQVSLLTDVPHFQEEPAILNQMLKIIDEPFEDGDRLELLSVLLQMVKVQGEQKKKKTPKVVIFTNFTVVAKEIAAYLQNFFGLETVANYNKSMDKEDVELNIESFRTLDECFILVADSSGEEGRNLQFADILIHFDLPLNPNRIEQRVGRLDRIGRVTPYTTYVLGGPDDESSLFEAWNSFLTNGLQVFHKSISSLQFFVEDIMPRLMKEFYIKGIAGIGQIMETIEEQIQAEKVKNAEQHVLDEIDSKSKQSLNFYNKLKDYEENFDEIQQGLEPWICEALNIKKIERNFTFTFEAKRGTLVPLNYLLPIYHTLNRPGCYDRDEVVYHKECNLYRIGNSLIEVIRDYIHWDDRGQTFAIWRKSNVVDESEGMEVLAFVMNYIIEGDVKYAKEVIEDFRHTNLDEKALQRKLDYHFPPMFQTNFVDLDGNTITDPAIVTELSTPFVKKEEGGSDQNMTKENLEVIDKFISEQYWPEIIDTVCDKFIQQIQENNEFRELCNTRHQKAEYELDYLYSQMKLRIQAGELTGKESAQSPKDLQFEKTLNEALKKGILQPKITLDSIGFIVLSGREMEEKNGRISTNPRSIV